jgi:hypothetical protein
MGWFRLVEEVEQQYHHQTDYQPKRQIFVKLIQVVPHLPECGGKP